MVTMASERDLKHPEIGKYVEKYLRAGRYPDGAPHADLAADREHNFGSAAVGYRTESMHGAGRRKPSE